MYMRGDLLEKFIDAYHSMPRMAIPDREKRTRDNKKIKILGPQTVFTEYMGGYLKIGSFTCKYQSSL